MTAIPADSFCILCPDRERLPYRGLVCEACRRWLASMIGDVRAYAAELASPVDLVPDARVLPAPFGPRLREWHDLDNDPTVYRRDYINALLPSASAGNPVRSSPVSGSRNPPIPINVDAVDIMMPARQGSVPATTEPAMFVESETVLHRYIRMVDGAPEYVVEEVTGRVRRFAVDADGYLMFADSLDQIGYLPLAAVLDSWVRDWREARHLGEGLPDANVYGMCQWLHTRIDWACDEHEVVVQFAEEIRDYRSTMAGILGRIDVPDYKVGVACPKCDARALYRRIGGVIDSATGQPVRDGSLWVECAECPAILSPDEYAEGVAEQVDRLRPVAA